MVASTIAGNTLLNAKDNWWGHFLGPKGNPNQIGQGVYASAKLDLSTHLACLDTSGFCVGTGAACTTETAILDPSTGKCVASVTDCHSSVSFADYQTRRCVATCPNSQTNTNKVCYAKTDVASGTDIATAITNAKEGDTLVVAAATRTQEITITKGITLLGAGVGSSKLESAAGGIKISSGARITIDGFSIKYEGTTKNAVCKPL